jgi:3alpha(or 20beta)-hydroxysteroid dehydrogenase
MKVTDGIELLEQSTDLMGAPFIVHPVLIWDQDAAVLIDTGLPGQASKLIEDMEKAGVPLGKLKKIILTHQDMDHAGNLPELLQKAGHKIEVVASAIEKPYVEGSKPLTAVKKSMIATMLQFLPKEIRAATIQAFQNPFTAPVDKAVEDGEVIPVCGGITAILTPGHSPGHMCLYHEKSGTLIAGDATLLDNGKLVGPNPYTTPDIGTAMKSLKKLNNFKINTMVCYHGGTLKDGVLKQIADLTAENKEGAKMQDKSFSLEGKTALVSGAARGIGAAIAKRLAGGGAKVAVTDIQEELGRKTAEEINKAGGKAIFIKLDTTVEEDWKNAVSKTVELLGGLDILVNNAGIFPAGLIEGTSGEQFQRVLTVNCLSPFLGIKHAISAMKPGGAAGKGGSIINMSSTFGIVGFMGVAPYCASKGGVRMLTKAAAMECAALHYNIRVNSVHPGTVDTQMPRGAVEDFIKAGLATDGEELFQHVIAGQPLGLIQPEDVAGTVYYLASDASKMVTGAEYLIDGGVCAM